MARFGVSISTSASEFLNAAKLTRPAEISIWMRCGARSATRTTVRSSRRSRLAKSSWISARECSPVEARSPGTTGVFTVAAFQSPESPRCVETAPCIRLMRATPVAGSSASAAGATHSDAATRRRAICAARSLMTLIRVPERAANRRLVHHGSCTPLTKHRPPSRLSIPRPYKHLDQNPQTYLPYNAELRGAFQPRVVEIHQPRLVPKADAWTLPISAALGIAPAAL